VRKLVNAVADDVMTSKRTLAVTGSVQ